MTVKRSARGSDQLLRAVAGCPATFKMRAQMCDNVYDVHAGSYTVLGALILLKPAYDSLYFTELVQHFATSEAPKV